MRLKQIKLVGFKSFVDPTVLSLGTQLIGIVGPNGCGKSNIIDAVKWVLGESSAKDLRGESMLDVIFNGSSARKPVGRAVVELLFDNLEGKLNNEYANFAEISIRREVDRDKQSEYYLNDRKCRKRDITDLFAGTGLLQNGYAIIGQGTVSRIIESKPEDLRNFVEEAADISIYKKRKHDTELRMGHTEENLNRLNDIINEQNRLLEKLEKQSVTAKKYQNYQAEKNQIEVRLLNIKANKFNIDLLRFNQEIQDLSLQLEKLITAKTKINASLEELKVLHAEKSDYFATIQQEYYALNLEISKIEQNLKYKQDQKNKYTQELAAINLELNKISIECQHDQTLELELNSELSSIEQDYINAEQHKNIIGNKYTLAQEKTHKIQQQISDLQLDLQQSQNKVEQIKHSIEQIENLSKELTFRIDKLNKENANYDQNGLLADLLLVEKKLRIEEKNLQDQHNGSLKISEQINQKKLYLKNLLLEKNTLQAKSHKLYGNIGSLQTLQQNNLEFNSLKLDWLNKNNIDKSGLLFDQLKVDDGWEIAAAVACYQYLDAILISKEIKDFSVDIWDSINNFKLSLIQEKTSETNTNSIQNNQTRSDLISITSKINADFSIFTWLQNYYIADNLAYALANQKLLLPNQCFVTKQGELVGFDWIIIDRIDHKQKILLNNKELKNLQESLNRIENELTQLNIRIEAAEDELSQLENSQISLLDTTKQQENSIKNIIAEVSAKSTKLDSIKLRSEQIVSEIKEYNNKISELTNKEKSLRANLANEIELISNLTLEFEELTTYQANLQNELAPLLKENQVAIQKFHDISLRKQQLITKHQSLQTAKNRSLEQIKVLEIKKNKLEEEDRNNGSSLQALGLQLEYLLEQKTEQQELVDITQNEINSNNAEINILVKEENNLNINIDQIKSKLEKVKLEQQAVSIRLDDLLVIAKNYNINHLDEILNSNEPSSISDQEQILNDLQQQLDLLNKHINKLGPVNLAAIEEFKIETERKSYLDLQLQDLTTALETLKAAIAKIDTETRKKFKSTFEEINRNFQELFPKLFGGGGAYLELTDNDLLATGVSVFAHPPGKKNSSIYLLSGGEKALTAVALIFSIFKLNPAPFCILDEVDAPLDDANVIRLGDLLMSMSSQVQFIFITHNKVTMKIANQLIGVTMKEPGVSRFVSVNVDEAVALID